MALISMVGSFSIIRLSLVSYLARFIKLEINVKIIF